jgi:hypothetical protein
MQTNQRISENRANNLSNPEQTGESSPTIRLGGWINRMFGCWHKEMSRPFSSEGQTYRACLHCGARRSFSVGRWEMRGDFYYSLPTSKHFRALSGLTPKPAARRATLGNIAQPVRQFA